MEEISKWIPVEDFDAENTGCMTARDYPTVDEPIVDGDHTGLSSK